MHGLSERYQAVVSRLTRSGATVITHDQEPLAAGDLLTITAREDEVDRLVADLGKPAVEEPWMDRSDIDFRRITLSNHAYVGRELLELRMDERFDSVVSRVRRGDIDIIATPDLILQSGDRLRVTAPRERLPEITTGSQLNPAPYAYAIGKFADQRVALGYAVLFPVSMIVKVLLAELMVVYF